MKWLLLKGIAGYQATVSRVMPAVCRFEPSCSHYAYEAVETHGAVRGAWLAVRRLARCRPGGGSGWDPVPPLHPEDAEAHRN
jgi:putative membrane protein insertion efficiency factor